MSTPILPFAVWASGTNQNSIPANDNSLRNQILNGLVIGVENSPPTSSGGDIYIVGSAPAGAFATFATNDLAIFDSGTWYSFAPAAGIVVNVAGVLKAWNGTGYADAGGGVASVNGQTGTVSLALEDLDDVDAATPTDGYALTWNNSAGKWEPAAPSGGMSNPMTTAGDIITGGSAGAPQRLAAGTNGNVLTMVAGEPAWAAAGGGGGLTGFTSALNTASPNNTVNDSRLTASGGTTNQSAGINPKGNAGFYLGPPADETTHGGNVRGAQSIDLQLSRTTATQVASGSNSIAIGSRCTASSTGSIAIGYAATCSAVTGVAIGESTNCSATAVAIGNNVTASGVGGVSIGRNSTNVSGSSAIGIGNGVSVNGDLSMATGSAATVDQRIGFTTHGIVVDFQDSNVGWRGQKVTTDSTKTAITATGAAVSANQRHKMAYNSLVTVVGGMIHAKRSSDGACASWKWEGAIKSVSGTLAWVGGVAPTPVLIGADGTMSSCAPTIEIDSGLASFGPFAVGLAATTIIWQASHPYQEYRQ